MGLQYRAIRAAASALLIATAIGVAGTAGMTSALAADPATVELSGVVLGAGDAPLAGVHLTTTEEDSADGGLAANQVVTAVDGHFTTSVFPWGTADAKATLTIAAKDELEVEGDGCAQTWGVELKSVSGVAFADAPPEPLTLVATTTLLGEVCGTTATPPPNRGSGGSTASPPPTARTGGGTSTTGRPAITPPPTDATAVALESAGADRHGPALTIGFAIGLLIAAALLLPRRGARRRD